MISITPRIESRGLQRGLKMFPKEVSAGYGRAILRNTLWAEKAVKQGLSHGVQLRKEIRKTVTSRVAGSGMERRGTVATTHISAVMIEKGATITPKKSGRSYVTAIKPDGTVVTKRSKGRYLAIPSDEVRTKKGKRARGAYVDSAIARTAGGPFASWVVMKGGHGVIYWKRYGESRVHVGGILKTSVTIPARPIWRPTARKAAKRMSRDIRKVLKNARQKSRL